MPSSLRSALHDERRQPYGTGWLHRPGKQNLHQTIRGRPIAAIGEHAEGQFAISDERPPHAVAARLRELDLEPVWKDWDAAILNAA